MTDIFEPTFGGVVRRTQFAMSQPGYQKKTLNISLNCDKATMLRHARAKCRFGAVPLRYLAYLDWVDQAKQALLASRVPRPPPDPRMTPGVNEVCFLMEFVEATFMNAFVATLARLADLTSVLWLHDGIWVSPPPARAHIDEAMRTACEGTGCFDVRIVGKLLAGERLNLIASFPPPATANAGSRLKRRFLELGHSRVVKPRVMLASAEAQLDAANQRKRKFDPQQTTLLKFLVRKKQVVAPGNPFV
jgi:hypothetical protein